MVRAAAQCLSGRGRQGGKCEQADTRQMYMPGAEVLDDVFTE